MIGTSGCSSSVLRAATVPARWSPRDQAMASEHPFDLSATCVEDPSLARTVVAFGTAFVELQSQGEGKVVSLPKGELGVHCSHVASPLLRL